MTARPILVQTAAMLLDAYRELNSRRLFWVTLALSLVVVLAVAAVGINARGLTLLGWEFDTRPLTSDLVPPRKFYLFLFANLAVPIWLTWAASILALISTASIFPDFIASGAIEMTLARPISRPRLFLTKYVLGLLFVTLQVAVFAAACCLVVRLRGGVWEPRIFLAVPIVVASFSYLFAFCVLFGMLTRSTIAALLLTLVVWLGLWGLNMTDGTLLFFRERAALQAERAARQVERLAPGPTLERARAEAAEAAEAARTMRRISAVAAWLKTLLPKTAETIQLLDRWTLTPEDKAPFGGPAPEADDGPAVPFGPPDRELAARLEAATRERSAVWVLGSSLACEAVVVGLAAWLFCRRDF